MPAGLARLLAACPFQELSPFSVQRTCVSPGGVKRNVVAQRIVHRFAWHLEALFSSDGAATLSVAEPFGTIGALQ